MEISLNNSLNKVVIVSDEQVLAAERTKLLMEIEEVKSDLTDAYSNFNFVSDFLMVDYYTYQIKAFETRFEYLIKKAKVLGIRNL
jgi:hypothetical protein